jgi:iron complex transport system substrate-binding protein
MRSGTAAIAAALLAIAGLLAGCDASGGESRAAIRVTDGAHRVVALERPARRVVSIMPALTDWVVAMGAADRLVARTDYDSHPSIAALPSVGGGLDPSVEWLAALGPDLVLAWPDIPSRSLVSRLDRLGIPVYTAPIQTVEQALAAALDLGVLLGEEAAAAAATAAIRDGLDELARSVDGLPRPRVLFLIGVDPLMAVGPGTFLDELLYRAGGENVLADLSVLWPTLSLEEVVRRAPEVVVVGSFGLPDPATALRGRPGWRDVPAVRAGRVHAVDPDLVNRPGPSLHRAATTLAALIHPRDQ